MANLPSPGQDIQDEDIFLENGSLSYENPNYQLNFGHLSSVRLEDALNSNTEHFNLNSALLRHLDMNVDMLSPDMSNMDLGMELELAVRNGTSTSSTVGSGGGNATRQRRHYASLDPTSMGVDVQVGPVMNLRSPDFDNNRGVLSSLNETNTSTKTEDSTIPQRIFTRQNEDDNRSESPADRSDEDSQVAAAVNSSSSSSDESPQTAADDELPPGWEKHEDDDGPYYWHIKSGTIQREPPPPPAGRRQSSTGTTSQLQPELKQQEPTMKFQRETVGDMNPAFPGVHVVPRSTTSFALSDIDNARNKEENAFKRRSYPAALVPPSTSESSPSAPLSSTSSRDARDSRAIRFAVRSLGWVEIAEEDLTPERSSKAVNRCIVDLSLGRNDLLDVVGRWGDGKDLFMDLDEGSLKLIDPENGAVLNSQPIHTIRVWGVGRDNGRDFAYVARDRVSRRHMCHVFRCDTPARTIANTLRDICKKIMIERSLQHSSSTSKSSECGSPTGSLSGRSRPSNLPTEQRRPVNKIGQILSSQSFPTPMEEPRKVLKAQYIGSLPVYRPSGMDVLNDAIDQMMNQVPRDQWRDVNVSVAPSVVTITDSDDEEKIIVESRVRFLSFLGIGRDVETCAFIVHTANDIFIAHVLYCYPSSGAICKTIEAACKLRYQKCLDAHGALRGRATAPPGAQTPTGRSLEGIGAALKSVFGSITGKRSSTSSSVATADS